MCGIAGIVKWNPRHGATPAAPPWNTGDFSPLHKMLAAIAHRGPDGQGIWTDPRPNHTAALVHSRLAIIDLPGGKQPMANEDASVHVVFNGEIYNHADLRAQLKSAGHTFATDHSDTEVLVHGWEQWGTDLPSKLLGMFAFAIWDTRTDTLFLARDRMGQKPLFYASLDDGLVFASTIPAVLAWPDVPRRVPHEQIGLYLLLGYFPAPQTIYRDISQLLPGAWLRLRKDVLDGDRYWTPMVPRPSGSADLRSELQRSVRSQLIADTPIACFLSGGLDSSIIATLTQQTVTRVGGRPIQTVSVGFAEDSFDETAHAAAVAAHIHGRHTRLEVHAGQDVMETLQLLMRTTLGQPFADSSILPTYHLSKAVRQIAPVALSGDGADELFAGYDRYRAMMLLARWGGWGSLARFMPRSAPVGSLAKQERYRRLAAAARATIPSERYTRLVEIFPLDLAEKLLQTPIMDYFPLPEEYGLPDNSALSTQHSALRLAMLRDQQEYLPGDVLWKVDSASMSPPTASIPGTALEVRSPFLDHRVVEFANSLGEGDLLRGGMGKQILRETFASDLPQEILQRSKKGFAVPIGNWFRSTLRAPLTDLLFAQNSFTSTHLHKPTAEKLLHEHLTQTRDHTHRLFALLMLELFWQSAAATLEP